MVHWLRSIDLILACTTAVIELGWEGEGQIGDSGSNAGVEKKTTCPCGWYHNGLHNRRYRRLHVASYNACCVGQ